MLADIAELERTHSLNEEEQHFVFERRLQIFCEYRSSQKRIKSSVLNLPSWIRGRPSRDKDF